MIKIWWNLRHRITDAMMALRPSSPMDFSIAREILHQRLHLKNGFPMASKANAACAAWSAAKSGEIGRNVGAIGEQNYWPSTNVGWFDYPEKLFFGCW